MKEGRHQTVTIPSHPFFYTLDQVAILLSYSLPKLKARCYWVGRTLDRKSLDQLEAVNVAPPKERADWRVDERELLRWLARMGYRVERR